LRDDDLLAVARLGDGHAPLRERALHFLARRRVPDELLKRVEVDRELPEPAMRPREDFIFDRMPFGELAEIRDDAIRIRAEIMRAVGVQQHARGVVVIVRVAANVRAAGR